MIRTCKRCGETYPLTAEFWRKMKDCKNGFRPICKSCVCEVEREYKSKPEFKKKDKTYRSSKAVVERNRIHVLKYQASEKGLKNRIEYRSNTKENVRLKNVDKLSRSYVASQLNIPVDSMTDEVFETKKLIIQLRRELKK